MRNTKFILIILIVVTGLVACKKNELRLTEFDLPTEKAFVRFALLSPGTPAVMIKVNDQKINGASTSGTTGFYPSTSNFPDYAAVPTSGNFRLSLPNTGTGNDSVLLFNGNIKVAAGKFYSVVLADTAADRTVFSVEDKLTALADSGFFKIRLINAMPKSPAIHLVRIDSTSPTLVARDTIARDIAYKSATDFIKTSISPLPGYSFLRFRTVTSTGFNLVTSTPPTPAALNQRSTTIYASGYFGGLTTYAPALTAYIYNQ